jgi:hypothetical protein
MAYCSVSDDDDDDDDDKDKRANFWKLETKRCSFGCYETFTEKGFCAVLAVLTVLVVQ